MLEVWYQSIINNLLIFIIISSIRKLYISSKELSIDNLRVNI